MTEAEMVADCYSKLKRQNVYKEIVLEVPYLSRCIDMILVDNNNEIISIEFKLKNWKQAINQASDHKLGVDKAYICMPQRKTKISEKLIDELTEKGIGLFSYDIANNNPLDEVVPANKVKQHWEPYVISLKSIINRISNNEVFELKK